MVIKYHENLVQGSEEWYAARCGLLTASEMKHIITPAKLEYAKNDKEKSHLYELLAQRITRYVEPHYMSDDMIRGQDDESYARGTYEEHFAEVVQMGFITNDKWGFTLGYSPDGLVGEDGIIECKSRRQKFQVEAIVTGQMPDDFKIQVQTGLLVTERKWCDFITYSGGLPMYPIRVEADARVQDAIVAVATIFHDKLNSLLMIYADKLLDPANRLIPTERRSELEIQL